MTDDAFYEPYGSGIEVAILKYLQMNEIEIETELIKRNRNNIIETNIPFSPERKK